jgi:acetyl-CoA carboxylase, biotin carboxylase subunit
MALKTLLIANRGEIAVRIIRAAKELGVRTIQAYSKADQESLAVSLADEAIDIGPPQASKSYLNMPAIIDAARKTGADAIHPGYGFLAENADFAELVEESGLIFVGPHSNSIRLLGNKLAARRIAKDAGIPTVPGSDGPLDSAAEARLVVKGTGFPVMIKAAAGGGGRGIRLAHSMEELERLMPQARAEAQAAFGDGSLYIEKAVTRARHIEVQILGDGERVVHFFERECSLQRRRQKLWEEAPSPSVSWDVRARLCNAAVALASAVKYRSAGTLEFLYDESSGSFYFLEMNTRIQVEHPTTEFITGTDLVREMILVAAGNPLRLGQEEIGIRGHAIEVRINAEDPSANFAPLPGTVSALRIPGGPGVRFDTMLYSGYSVPPFYDSLLGKLIVWDEDRVSALERLKRALGELEIGGIKTTKPLYEALVRDHDVRAGRFDTGWLERWLASHYPVAIGEVAKR